MRINVIAEACSIGYFASSSLDEAIATFEEVAIKAGIDKSKIKTTIKDTRQGRLAYIQIPFTPGQKDAREILSFFANIGDVHGDYPTTYVLREAYEKGYNKVGVYFD